MQAPAPLVQWLYQHARFLGKCLPWCLVPSAKPCKAGDAAGERKHRHGKEDGEEENGKEERKVRKENRERGKLGTMEENERAAEGNTMLSVFAV